MLSKLKAKGLNKGKGSKDGKEDPFGNSPSTAYEKAQREWFERMGSPVVERDRYFILALCILGAFIALVFALAAAMPLSRAELIAVQVDKITGEAVPTRVGQQAYKPGNPEKQYFLTRWVRYAMALDPNTSPKDLSDAYEFCRGKAAEEFKDFMDKTKPLVRLRTESGLTRTVEIKSYSPVNDQAVMIRFSTEERAMDQRPVRKHYVMTVHYAIDPPTSEAAIMKNPLGLFVSHFAINEDATP